MKQDNFVLIISSPSGAGKTSLAKAIIESDSKFIASISATTRTKRELEIENQDYYFISKDTFKKMRQEDKFLEWAKVFDNYYGSPKDYVIEKMTNGFDILFDIDWQGARAIKRKLGKAAVSIFILPPSIDELARRLRSRRQDLEHEIEKRLDIAHFEISKHHLYDYVLINDDFNKTFKIIQNIIEIERLKRLNFDNFVHNLLENK
ncbi:MAG: guanylate kinase [Rickettsiales bacterium]